jgi:hypothetical protein
MTDRQEIYQAPKPVYPWASWFKRIAFRIIFPPILLWDALKFIVNAAIGKKVGEIILLAQKKIKLKDKHNVQNKINTINKSKDLNVKKPEVKTYDGAILDTVEINHLDKANILPKQQQYIINFVGTNGTYEGSMDQMADDAKALQCNVVGFNFRGVMNSTGKPKSADDLVTDGIAQVQRLLDKGVDPQNITLKGHSLGAGIATLVAKHFHDNKKKINLFNGRSFSSITNVVVGHIRTYNQATGHQELLGKKIVGWIAKPFIKFILALVKWEIDAESAYKSLPATHKEYMVIKSSKDARKSSKPPIDDRIITNYGSLHAALKSENRKVKAQINKQSINEGKKTPSELKEARKCLNKRKMITLDGEDGHNYKSNLNDRYTGNNANHFFRSFVKKAHAHHQEQLSVCRL